MKCVNPTLKDYKEEIELNKEKYISKQELAKYFNFSNSTINNYIKIGILPRPFYISAPKGRGRTAIFTKKRCIRKIKTIQKLLKNNHSMKTILKKLYLFPLSLIKCPRCGRLY